MVIRVQSILTFGLFLSLFTGLQGAQYYIHNRLQEVGALVGLLLFSYGAIRGAYYVRDLKWNWWVFFPIIFVLCLMIIPALAYNAHTGSVVLPSILNARVYLIVFLCPAIYLMYRNGYPLEKIERTFIMCLFWMMATYLLNFYFRDLMALQKSGDPWEAGLVTLDDVRGIRLKAPTPSLVVFGAISIMTFFQSRQRNEVLFSVLSFGICIHMWILIQSRGTMSAAIIGMAVFPFLLSKPSRRGIILALCIFVPFTIYVSAGAIHDNFASQDGASLRFHSYAIAWEYALKYPVVGMGQASAYSLSYQKLHHNSHFFPADIGLLGVMYKYGFTGTLIYFGLSWYMIQRMVTTNWMYKQVYGRHNRIMYGLLSLMLCITLNIMLTTQLVFAQGIAVGSFLIGYSSCWRHKLMTEHPELFNYKTRGSYRPKRRIWLPG